MRKKPEDIIVESLAKQFNESDNIKNRYKVIPFPPPNKLFAGMQSVLEITTLQSRKVDMVVLDFEQSQVMAIEVKYFKKKPLYAAYTGIDQAISLLPYGFDYVSLFHVYSYDLDDQSKRRGQLAWATLRMLNISLDFTFFVAKQIGKEQFSFRNMKADWGQYKLEEGIEVTRKYEFKWKYPNPLRNKAVVEHVKRLEQTHPILLNNAKGLAIERQQFKI